MDPVNVGIITIGDEILYGQTLDTNSHWMSFELDSFGFNVVHRATVSDTETAILSALEIASEKADIILMTGGLGPTSDDRTKPCLAKYFDVELVSNEGALDELRALFKQIDRELSESNIAQTNLPSNADYISNTMGTAPGIWIEENNKVYISMPGVPFEMKTMMTKAIIPRLQQQYSLPQVSHRIIRTIGIGESWLAEKIKSWEESLPKNIGLAYLPSLGQVKLRLTTTSNGKGTNNNGLEKYIDSLKDLVGKYIYGYDNDEIHAVIGQLLQTKGLTMATAESCTGGYLAHLITSIAGSSTYYQGSVIAYSNKIKEDELGVKQNTIEEYGVVSEQAVSEMALGICEKFNTNVGIATSGIAGPDGGTDEKPVGTIWVAVAVNGTVETRLLKLFKDRVLNIKMTSISSLALLWRILSK